MDTVAALKTYTSSRQTELRDARRKVELLEAEVHALEEALRIVSGEQYATSTRQTQAVFNEETESSGRRRGPQGQWREIMMEAAARLKGEFVLNDLAFICQEFGQHYKRPTLRAQVANYVTSGWLNRVHQGRFRFTEKGLSELANLGGLSGENSLGNEKPDASDAHASGLFAESAQTDLQRHQNLYQTQSGE